MARLSKTLQLLEEISLAIFSSIENSRRGVNAVMSLRHVQLQHDARFRMIKRKHIALRRLHEQGYIHEFIENGDRIISLTAKGVAFGLLRCMKENTRKLPPGHVCLVTFDIPETHRHIRHQLRQILRSLQFRKAHASAYISDYDVGIHLRAFVDFHNGNKWVGVYVAKEVPLLGIKKSTAVKK